MKKSLKVTLLLLCGIVAVLLAAVLVSLGVARKVKGRRKGS